MTRVAIVDHGAGNLVSIAQGLRRAGGDVFVTSSPADLDEADGVVLPGVGTTGAAMRRLARSGLVDPLRRFEGPLLGICVGLQLFFESSEEDDGGPGLALIEGTVRRLRGAPLLPHIGWNDVAVHPDPVFDGLGFDRDGGAPTFYFVHSFAPVPADEGVVIGTTDYGGRFVAAARSGNLVGVQFHPERSGAGGLRVLSNFVTSCREASRAA